MKLPLGYYDVQILFGGADILNEDALDYQGGDQYKLILSSRNHYLEKN